MRLGSQYLRILAYGVMVSCLSNVSAGQGREVEKAEKARDLVEKEKKNEKKQKKRTRKELDRERREVIERLESLQRRYEDKGKNEEASAIEAQIKLIRKRLGKLEKGALERKKTPARERDLAMFLYNRNYVYSSSEIKGSLRFGRNGKVKVNYVKGKERYSREWKFILHDDHLEILGDEQLGRIYLSEVPSKKPNSLMVRWGGELMHELSIAEIK